MDLHTVEAYLRPTKLEEIGNWQEGWACLAGGTWMFNEPQPQVKTLVDLTELGWSELEATPEGLTIGAMSIMSRLLQFSYPQSWTAVEALWGAVRELASFKVQNIATVGGNLCLAIPAGTFAPTMVLLGANYEIVPLKSSPYWVSALEFQTGAKQTILQPGELLRKIWIPQANLEWQVNYKRICVASAGLAVSIVVAAYHPQTHQVRFAIGAAIPAPCLLEFEHVPSSAEISAVLDAQIPLSNFLADKLASAVYRRQVTQVLMQRSLEEVITGHRMRHS